MKKIKVLLKILVIIVLIVFINGLYYIFAGQFKSMQKLSYGKELSLYECCSIYSVHTAAWLSSWILSPEAAEQCFLMSFSKEGSTHIRKAHFMKSDYIRKQIALHNGRTFTINYPLNEITSNKKSNLRKELRYALAYDGAEYYPIADPEKDEVLSSELRLDVKYDNYTAVYHIGIAKITFNWQLMRHIQNRGWLHKCTIIYYE